MPLNEEQRQRHASRRRPFVLGRDNVARSFTPIPVSDDALALQKGLFLVV